MDSTRRSRYWASTALKPRLCAGLEKAEGRVTLSSRAELHVQRYFRLCKYIIHSCASSTFDVYVDRG